MQKRFVFATGWPDRSGDLGKVDCIQQYMCENDLCIDQLQYTEAEVVVEQMGGNGALLITVMVQMQPIYWNPPLDNRVFCSCRRAYLMEVMVACH